MQSDTPDNQNQGGGALPIDMNAVYARFASYPFERDIEFMNGLKSVTGEDNALLDPSKADLVGQAKAFYFSRLCGQQITWKGYLEHTSAQAPVPQPSTTIAGQPPLASDPTESSGPAPTNNDEATLSFLKLSELIATGQLTEIPFNREIPNVLSEEEPSKPEAPVRKKPWEA
ncbi:hypothetical protein FRB99_007050 [Tulasnella sp. 403]|nr:hypothetical protein FRB99_007050 [Tulasnella sp. 403]